MKVLKEKFEFCWFVPHNQVLNQRMRERVYKLWEMSPPLLSVFVNQNIKDLLNFEFNNISHNVQCRR